MDVASRSLARSPGTVGLNPVLVHRLACLLRASSGPASRRRPCASLTLLFHQDGRGLSPQAIEHARHTSKTPGMPRRIVCEMKCTIDLINVKVFSRIMGYSITKIFPMEVTNHLFAAPGDAMVAQITLLKLFRGIDTNNSRLAASRSIPSNHSTL